MSLPTAANFYAGAGWSSVQVGRHENGEVDQTTYPTD